MTSIYNDNEKCNQCGLCVIECPTGIIKIVESDTVPSWVDGGDTLCINCGHCVAVCPPGALSLDMMNPEDCTPIKRDVLPTQDQVEHFLKSRRSVRVYKECSVEREKLAKLIDIARYAPTGCNFQPVHWLVVENADEVRRLAGLVADWIRLTIKESPWLAGILHSDLVVKAWDSGKDVIMRDAPHIIVAHANKDIAVLGDCQIALTYLELAAYSMGLGACWNGYFQLAATSYPPMIEALQLPQDHQSFGAMMVGYPAHKMTRIPLRNEPKIVWR